MAWTAPRKRWTLGATGYLVEVGGELRARGLRPDGQPWRVAVEVPDASDAHALALPLRDLSIATSGDYRRHAGSGDARYAHTIDPRDGQPCATAWPRSPCCTPTACRPTRWPRR